MNIKEIFANFINAFKDKSGMGEDPNEILAAANIPDLLKNPAAENPALLRKPVAVVSKLERVGSGEKKGKGINTEKEHE